MTNDIARFQLHGLCMHWFIGMPRSVPCSFVVLATDQSYWEMLVAHVAALNLILGPTSIKRDFAFKPPGSEVWSKYHFLSRVSNKNDAHFRKGCVIPFCLPTLTTAWSFGMRRQTGDSIMTIRELETFHWICLKRIWLIQSGNFRGFHSCNQRWKTFYIRIDKAYSVIICLASLSLAHRVCIPPIPYSILSLSDFSKTKFPRQRIKLLSFKLNESRLTRWFAD